MFFHKQSDTWKLHSPIQTKHNTNKQKYWSDLPRIVSISIKFFMILSQKPPHMDSSSGGGGSRWLSCILISACLCILLALVDRRCGAHSKVCQYKWSNQGTLAVLCLSFHILPENCHFMKNQLIHVIMQIVVGVKIVTKICLCMIC